MASVDIVVVLDFMSAIDVELERTKMEGLLSGGR